MLNIVASYQTILKFKKSRYFKNNLGLVATVEKNGRRTYNEKDKFSNFYNTQYRTTIYGQGNIGNIKFYTDHYIKDSKIGVYYTDKFEEFIFEFDDEVVSEKGLDFYLGSILKKVEESYEERVKKNEIKKIEQKEDGNSEMIFKNPGSVTYADLKAYLKDKQKQRYKN